MRKLVCSFLFLVLLLANPFGTTVTALPNKSTLSKKEVNEPLTRKQVEKKTWAKSKTQRMHCLLGAQEKDQKAKKAKTKNTSSSDYSVGL